MSEPLPDNYESRSVGEAVRRAAHKIRRVESLRAVKAAIEAGLMIEFRLRVQETQPGVCSVSLEVNTRSRPVKLFRAAHLPTPESVDELVRTAALPGDWSRPAAEGGRI